MTKMQIELLMAHKLARAKRVAQMMHQRKCVDHAFTLECADAVDDDVADLNRRGDILRAILRSK